GVPSVAVPSRSWRIRWKRSALLPRLGWQTQVDLLHGDAAWNRADKITEIAPDAFRFVHARDARKRRRIRFIAVCVCSPVEVRNRRYGDDVPALRFAHGRRGMGAIVMSAVGSGGICQIPDAIQMDTLVSAIPARGVAKLAADTFFFADAGDDFVVEVEVLPLLHARKAFPLEFGNRSKAFFGHPVG